MKIELRYDYDTNGFFAANPQAKVAMRAAADFYESLIEGELLAIDPVQQGQNWNALTFNPGNPFSGEFLTIPNLVVPENTIIIFVGGTNNIGGGGVAGPGTDAGGAGSQEWFNLVRGRGKAGALATPATDFAPWGGFISFSMASPWNYQLDKNVAGTIPFVSVAIHEIAHVLGIGASDSWKSQRSDTHFNGPHALAVFGGPVPLELTDPSRAHWRDNMECTLPHGHSAGNANNVLSRAFGGFGTPHGFEQIALMDPAACPIGPFLKVLTDLDIAALRDIGWKIRPQQRLFAARDPEFRLAWESSGVFEYQVERSGNLLPDDGWETIFESTGDGTLIEYMPDIAGKPRGFFRLNVLPRVVAEAMAHVEQPVADEEPSATFTARHPVMVSGCFCHSKLFGP